MAIGSSSSNNKLIPLYSVQNVLKSTYFATTVVSFFFVTILCNSEGYDLYKYRSYKLSLCISVHSTTHPIDNMNSYTTIIMSDTSPNTDNPYSGINRPPTPYLMPPSNETDSIPPYDLRSLTQTNRYTVPSDSSVYSTCDEEFVYNLEEISTTEEASHSEIDVDEWP